MMFNFSPLANEFWQHLSLPQIAFGGFPRMLFGPWKHLKNNLSPLSQFFSKSEVSTSPSIHQDVEMTRTPLSPVSLQLLFSKIEVAPTALSVSISSCSHCSPPYFNTGVVVQAHSHVEKVYNLCIP
jgi:hypothetical protein